jgi:DNA-binding MarR family transcriptional regulator
MSAAKPQSMMSLGADRSGLGLAILLEQTVRLVYPERSPHDMHPGQWAALRYLSRANRDARTVAGLARFLGVTQGPASRAVSALERKGLVEGLRDPKDRRTIRLSLTKTGEDLLADDPIHAVAAALAALPAEQAAALRETVGDLFVALTDRKANKGGASAFVVPSDADA